jgi:hypothetical protein
VRLVVRLGFLILGAFVALMVFWAMSWGLSSAGACRPPDPDPILPCRRREWWNGPVAYGLPLAIFIAFAWLGERSVRSDETEATRSRIGG